MNDKNLQKKTKTWKQTKQSRQQRSKTLIGNKNRLGKKHTEESKQQISVSLKGRKYRKTSEQERDQIRLEYKNGATYKELSKKFNRGISHLKRIIDK